MRTLARHCFTVVVGATSVLVDAPPALGQAVEWAARYNGGFVDNVEACPGVCNSSARHALAVDGAGNVYVTGRSGSGGLSLTVFRTVKYAPDGTLLWNVASSEYGTAAAVAADAAGNAYATGTVNGDIKTFKYAASDGHVIWSATYDGPAHGSDAPVMVAVDGTGNVLVTGGSSNGADYDFVTLKHAASDGHVVWSARYSGGSGDDRPAGLAVDSSGDVYVTGTAQNGNVTEFHTIKYAGVDGSVLWSQPYAGPGNGSDAPRAIALDVAGNALVTGSSQAGYFDPYGDFRTIKYAAADGDVLWDVAFDGPAQLDDAAYAVAVDSVGNAYVTGTSDAGESQGGDFRTIKYAAADGGILWNVAYDGPAHLGDSAWAIGLDAAGDALVTGASYDGANTPAYRSVKHGASDGAVLWTATYGGAGQPYDFALAQAVDMGGNVIVTGYAWNGSNGDFRTLKYSTLDGGVLLDVRDGSGSPSRESARAIAADGAGNLVVTGATDAPLAPADMLTVAYAPDGTTRWARSYDGSTHGEDRAFGVALDAAGNAYVTGQSTELGSGSDFRTTKYAASDGTVVWSVAYGGPGDGYDSASGVAVGPGNSVYVTGAVWNGLNDDWHTIKYSAADGSIEWVAVLDGGSTDQPSAFAVDALGNVYVTGGSWSTGGAEDFRTVKYAAADGAVLWQQVFDGGVQDVPAAIALDLLGNAYVTGLSYSGPSYDYRTLKYAAGSGAVLWSRAYDCPLGGHDQGTAVAVDALGNAYVTGACSRPPGFEYEARTLKYAAADGALLWASAPPGIQWGRGLALDASGNAYVTGRSQATPSSSSDVGTAKLASSDGHAIWSAKYGGRGEGHAIAVSGDAAYVLGEVAGPVTDLDLVTVKYVTDNLAPLNPTALSSAIHVAGGWSTLTSIGMRWSGAFDPQPASGLLGYSVAFDTAATTVPDMTVEVPQATDPHGVTSATLPEGQSHYFHLRTCDLGGNCSAVVHAGPYGIDTTAPGAPASLTSSSHTPGVPTADLTIDLQWEAASDPLSNGVASGIDGYGWFIDDNASTACNQQKLAEEWSTSVSVPVALGTWYAHVCARDNAGNWSGVTTAGPYLIGDPADLSVTLTDDVDPMHANGTVTYAATYANAGPSPAPGATLVLTLPPGLSFVSSNPGEPVCSGAGRDVKCALGDLSSSAGGTVTVTAQALPRTKGLQTASAKLRAEASDTDLGNNTATQATLVKFVKGDLQDDWATDLFLASLTTNENVAWLMNGTTRLSEAPIDPPTPAHATQQVAGVDDFDGDGKNDLAFWDSATGEVELWLMNGAARVGDPVPLTGAAPLPLVWRLSATADFDRDGWPDLLWRNGDTQKLAIWTLNGTAKAGELVPSPDQAAHANWQVVGAVDLNGDGNVDLLWYNVSTGKIVYWWMDASVQRITGNFTSPASAGNANWKVLATGDYGAGPGGVADTADLVWRNETSGKYVVWHLDLAGNRTAGTFTTPDAPASPLDWTVVGPR